MFDENHALLKDLKILVEKYPNDTDLGAKVRLLIDSYEYTAASDLEQFMVHFTE